MSASRFWTITNSEVKITGGGGGSGKGKNTAPGKPPGAGGGKEGKGAGWTGRGKGGPGSGGDGGAGIPLGLGAKVQVINVADFVGQTYVTITTLDGHALADFVTIDFVIEDVTGTGDGASSLIAELSVDGSTWRDGAGAYRNVWCDANIFGVRTDPFLLPGLGSHPWNLTMTMSSIGVAVPTHMRARQMAVDLQPNIANCRSQTAVADTALRFKISPAAKTFTSGTIRMMGILKGGERTVQSFDFGATQKASHTFDIPKGHHMAEIHVVEGRLTDSGTFSCRVGLNGTDLDAAGSYIWTFTNQSSGASGVDTKAKLTKSEVVGIDQDGYVMIWNLRKPAPVFFVGSEMHDTAFSSSVLGHQTSEATPKSYNQITVFNTGAGEMTDGTVYLVTHSCQVDIETREFTVASNSEDFTDLGNFPLVLIQALDMVWATADGWRSRCSTDGISYDAGAADYDRGFISDVSDASNTGNEVSITPNQILDHGGGCAIAGFGVSCKLVWRDAQLLRGSGSSDITHTGGYRNNTQVNTALRVFGILGFDATAGKLWRLGYRF